MGTYYYTNGDIYKGEWKGGKLNGEGNYIYKSGKAIYKGNWVDGKK
jgi:hypothetical protein